MHLVRPAILIASLLAISPASASSVSTSAASQIDPEVSFSIASSTTLEASSQVSVQVVLSAVHTADVTIPYSVSGSADGGDATVPAGPLVVPAGQTGGTIDIQVHDDALSEGRERLVLTLGVPTNGTLGTLASFELVIDDDEPAATLAFDTSTSSASEGAGTVLITLTLSAPRTEDASVTFGLSGTATAGGVDVAVTPLSPLVIPAGATTASLSAQIVSDSIDESDEDLIVTLLVTDNCALGATTQHTLTILDDDDPPTISFATPNSTIVETDPTIGIGVELSAASAFDVTVPVTTSGTATDGVDYTWSPQLVTILAGSTSAALDVVPVDDMDVEPSEIATFTFGMPTGATPGAVTSHDLLIIDDDGGPRVAVFQSAASAVDESAGVVSLVVELDQHAPQPVMIPVTAAGTAVAGADYDLLTTMITIPVGALTATVDVNVIDDQTWEPIETVDLSLGTPTGATLGATTIHVLSILDDDPIAASFVLAAQAATEGSGAVLVDIVLSAPATTDVTIPLVLSGTAIAGGVDLDVMPNPLVIATGQSGGQFQVSLVGDDLYENDETLVMTFGTLTGAAPGALTEFILTIEDDDPLPVVEFSAFRTVVRELDGSFDLRFQLDTPSGLDVSVPFTATGTASGPGDITLPPSPAVVPAGEMFVDLTVTLVVDRIPELGERILFTLGAPIDAVLGTTTSYLVLINDGDLGPIAVAPPLTPSVTDLIFPPTRVGDASAPQVLFFTNLHSAPVVLDSVSVAGATPGELQVSFPVALPITLAPAQSVPIDVTFTPLERGVRELIVQGRQQGQGAPPIAVSVTGVAFGVPGEEVVMNVAPVPFSAPGGEEWSSEYGATGGALSTTSILVSGTTLEGLYQTYRIGSAFDYAIELPNGAYDVVIHSWEPVMVAPGQRVFDVLMEGALAFDDLDLFVEVGQGVAYASAPTRVALTDGILDISIQSSVANALVSAIEVRSVPLLSSATTALSFGVVEQGVSSTLNMVVQNDGLFSGTIDRITFQSPNLGSSEDFVVTVGGVDYPGSASSITHNTAIALAPGMTDIPVTFTPSVHADHDFVIEFESTSTGDLFAAAVTGGGGANAGWGFLHPVPDISPAFIVDYDANGSEAIALSAEASHTHEPGHAIVGYDWTVSGASISTSVNTSYVFPVGSTPMSLTIADDNVPASTATDTKAIVVHPVDQVPGPLALYYDAAAQGATALLSSVPAEYNFAERLSTLDIAAQDGRVGGSAFFGDVMVRWVADFDLASARTLEFLATGGVARSVFVDGSPAVGPLLLSSGAHDLELRFAVDEIANLPLTLQILEGGVQATDVENSLVHDEQAIVPVIHSMPTLGIDLGGNSIEIEGFGFFPESQTVVNWGGTVIPSSSFDEWGGGRIVLTSPPGTGSVQVTVETPNGISNAVQFVYSVTGPVPVRFDLLTSDIVNIANVTCAKWGPDGRLYVSVLDGTLRIITYNDDYSVAGIGFAAGVSGLTNRDTVAIAFNPWDVYDPLDPASLKVYLAHGEQWQNGGGAFTGASDFTGQISILSGPNFDVPQPIVTGLGVSNHDHSVNGMEFDDNGDLLLCAGGNTNAGVNWPLLGDVPESPFTGAILKILLSKPGFNGTVEYLDLVSGVIVDDQVLGEQVEVAPGVDVEVLAPGFRNAYDLTLHTNGYLYVTDNGPNGGYGPASTSAQADAGLPHPWSPDSIDLVEEGNYYGAANRARGRIDQRENVYRSAFEASIANAYTAPITTLDSSSNGVDEYRAMAFNSAMRGEIIAMKYTSGIYRVALSADGRRVTGTSLHTTSGAAIPRNPGLDVITGPGGAILAIDYLWNKIQTQVPDDVGAIGVTPYDITPWRMPAAGGQPFVIGGRNFGTNIGSVSVTIGGQLAVVTSVSQTRIRGIVPPSTGGLETDLLDVVVQVGLTVRTLPAAFRYLAPSPGMKRGTWRTAQDVPAALGDVVSAVVDGELFLFGDGDTRTFTADLLQDTWSLNGAQRPFGGGGHAAEALDGKVYLFGGFTAGAAGQVQIYDPVLDQWSFGTPMPWSAGGCVTATIDGLIYVGGGVAPGGGTVANFSSYDPVADTWTSLGTLPTAVHMAAAGTDGQQLFVFGGRQGMLAAQNGIDEVQIYDPVLATWQTSSGGQVAAMPLPRSSTGRAILWDGEFYVMGGADAVTTFSEVQTYAPTSDSWRTERAMLTARQAISPALFQSRIFVHGGADVAGYGVLSTTEVFSPR